MIDETTIQARIAELEAERERYIAQANTQISVYQAAIGELTRLIARPVVPATEYVEQTVAERAA